MVTFSTGCYLSTKFRIDTGRLDDIPGQIERSLHESLERLQRQLVDLFQLHNHIETATDSNHALSPQDVLRVADGLDAMRTQGLIRFSGITAIGHAASCYAVIASGRFDSAQVYYNMLNPSAGQAVPQDWSAHDFSGVLAACRNHGVAAMGIRVFAAGVIATDLRHGREGVLTSGSEIADEELRARQVFAALGEAHGTRAQTGLRFALAQPDLSCAVVGLAELDHLEQVLAAANAGPLPEAAIATLQPLYETDFGRLGPPSCSRGLACPMLGGS
jgi:D-threo-aldose 1-dehydrogenase